VEDPLLFKRICQDVPPPGERGVHEPRHVVFPPAGGGAEHGKRCAPQPPVGAQARMQKKNRDDAVHDQLVNAAASERNHTTPPFLPSEMEMTGPVSLR
jgi:hypothetical protein